MLKFSFFEIQEPWIVLKEFGIYFDFVTYLLNSVESYGSWISKKLNFSMRFPLEFNGGFYWFKNPSGSFRCWFRCTKPFLNFLFSWGTFPSAKLTDILVIISKLFLSFVAIIIIIAKNFEILQFWGKIFCNNDDYCNERLKNFWYNGRYFIVSSAIMVGSAAPPNNYCTLADEITWQY